MTGGFRAESCVVVGEMIGNAMPQKESGAERGRAKETRKLGSKRGKQEKEQPGKRISAVGLGQRSGRRKKTKYLSTLNQKKMGKPKMCALRIPDPMLLDFVESISCPKEPMGDGIDEKAMCCGPKRGHVRELRSGCHFANFVETKECPQERNRTNYSEP